MRWIWHQPVAKYGPVGVQKKRVSQRKKSKGKGTAASKADKAGKLRFQFNEIKVIPMADNQVR
jgi:hypothetical protein